MKWRKNEFFPFVESFLIFFFFLNELESVTVNGEFLNFALSIIEAGRKITANSMDSL